MPNYSSRTHDLIKNINTNIQTFKSNNGNVKVFKPDKNGKLILEEIIPIQKIIADSINKENRGREKYSKWIARVNLHSKK